MSARHRQLKVNIRELGALIGSIETIQAAYAIVVDDLPESEVAMYAVLTMRRTELAIALGAAHTQISEAKQALAAMLKRKAVA
jgi:hypothetical protein